eukprot:4787128-Pleurochrysis_carterae.AAC.1
MSRALSLIHEDRRVARAAPRLPCALVLVCSRPSLGSTALLCLAQVSIRFVLFAALVLAVSAFTPATTGSLLSSSRVVGVQPAVASLPCERAGAVIMSAHEGPPETEMLPDAAPSNTDFPQTRPLTIVLRDQRAWIDRVSSAGPQLTYYLLCGSRCPADVRSALRPHPDHPFPRHHGENGWSLLS